VNNSRYSNLVLIASVIQLQRPLLLRVFLRFNYMRVLFTFFRRKKIAEHQELSRMSLSPEYASDISSEFRSMNNVNALTLPIDSHSALRRSGRSRSNEQDSPTSDSKAKRMRQTNLRLPRGVQRQSRNGAAYSGWVTVEGYRYVYVFFACLDVVGL
jgi:hypothetical protein